MKLLRIVTGLWLTAGLSAGADKLALVGGTVHPVKGDAIPNATLVIEGERIAAVGRAIELDAETRVVDASGLHVYPALFSADTVLGLAEISAVRSTIDVREVGDFNPHVRAEIAFNPDSELLPVARSNGVLVALTAPQGALVSGTSAVMRLSGWTWEDMTLRAPAALHIEWPVLRMDYGPEPKKPIAEQRRAVKERLDKLKEFFAEARAYLAARQAEDKPQVPRHRFDARWEAMRPFVERELPVAVRADRLEDIRAVLEWAEAEGLKLIIMGGQDSSRLADELAAKDVGVVLNPVLGLPRRDDEPYDAVYSVPASLHKAGVRFAIATGSSPSSAATARTLPYHAAMAMAFGLPRAEALRSITLSPAELFGVADRLGSLEPGKEATLFLCDGDPLDIRSQVVRAYVAGREINLDDRHKRLWRKYRERP